MIRQDDWRRHCHLILLAYVTLMLPYKDRLVYFQELVSSPTVEQGFSSIRVCQMLSNLLQAIHLFRFDEVTGEIYILAGENDELEVVIYPDGSWEFVA